MEDEWRHEPLNNKCPKCGGAFSAMQTIYAWAGIVDSGVELIATCGQCGTQISIHSGTPTMWRVRADTEKEAANPVDELPAKS